MGSPILGSSNLPIIGANRCSRKWVNTTEGHKILPMNQSKFLRLHLTPICTLPGTWICSVEGSDTSWTRACGTCLPLSYRRRIEILWLIIDGSRCASHMKLSVCVCVCIPLYMLETNVISPHVH